MTCNRQLAARFSAEASNVYRATDVVTTAEWLANVLLELRAVFSQRSLGPVDRSMRRASYGFRVNGRMVNVPASAFTLAREIIGRRVYELYERFRVGQGDCVLDLGANIGIFSLTAAASGGTVVAIEAQSELVPEVSRLMTDNGIRTVSAIHGIVGSAAGCLSSEAGRSESSHWKSEPQEVDLDALLDDLKWEHVDFLKADIEGSEFALFSGEAAWLKKVKRIAMEVHAEHGDVQELARFLRDRSFTTIITDLEKRPVRELCDDMGFIYAIRG